MAAPGSPGKRNWKKAFKKSRRDAAQISQQADRQIEKFLIRRFDSLASVRRFIFLWIALFAILIFATLVQLRALSPYYQTLKPVPGGIYSEGVIGEFSNANPIYATSTADVAVSRLVFSGLFKYNSQNQLVGDLASTWKLNPAQNQYTVELKPGLTWQDGTPFTADDVVFTYHTIQDVEAQSALYSSWQGITVTENGPYSVIFKLKNPLSSFPYSLTNGIIPQHKLKDITPAQMRSAQFNTNPIGTGPFEWKVVEVNGTTDADKQQRISLAAFDHYAGGRPKLDGFNLTTFSDDQHLLAAFNKKQINAMSGLESIPDTLKKDRDVHAYYTPLTSETMAFFNNSVPQLADTNVRRALAEAVNRSQIPGLLSGPVKLMDEPLLPGQIGYTPALKELPYNAARANKILDQDGWNKKVGGYRVKGGEQLHLTMAAQDTQEYTQVAKFLQNQWAKLGVQLDVNYYSSDDLQSAIIANHAYDILLYGINIGVDPDVFAYWDSSQASISSQGHLNLSEYKSSDADQALEAGRTRDNPALRVIKYRAFLAAWAKDAPALVLYQPDMLYITRGRVFNYQRDSANSSADRFYNVQNWMVRQKHENRYHF